MIIIELVHHKFPIGQLVATPNALKHLTEEDVCQALSRHLAGDWGDLDPEDCRADEEALEKGLRLLSAYSGSAGVRFWIITERDRSATTILLPEDY